VLKIEERLKVRVRSREGFCLASLGIQCGLKNGGDGVTIERSEHEQGGEKKCRREHCESLNEVVLSSEALAEGEV